MKNWLTILFVCLLFQPVMGQNSPRPLNDSIRQSRDTVASNQDYPPHTSGTDTDEGLNLFLLVMAVGFLAVLCVGVLSILAVCGIAVLLTLGGILSFSVIVGLYKRSLLAGIRWAVFLLFGLGGAAAGVASYFIFRILRHYHFHIDTPVLISAGAGMVGGLICAGIFLSLVKRVYGYLQNRLSKVS